MEEKIPWRRYVFFVLLLGFFTVVHIHAEPKKISLLEYKVGMVCRQVLLLQEDILVNGGKLVVPLDNETCFGGD